ncbi:MAG: phosphate ABC transporter ATP-binding protein [Roseiflexaceae bacterium]
MYQLAQVTKQYGDRLVLNVPSLDIPRRDVLALVGPSGAGKSTLLRLLNFLEAPTAGMIRFQGQDINVGAGVPIGLHRQVTTVFQRPLLLATSVAGNVRYGLRLRGIRNAQERARAALVHLGLAHLADKPAHTLSGGEMQRVALARALVCDPEVLLLDEPTANLDPANVQVIERAIVDAQQQRQTTIVLVTHNLFQARRLAQRVGLLLDGQLVEVADVTMFFDAPRDPRTAAFVRGEMVY